MSDKTKFVVVEEAALCYVNPGQPDTAFVLSISYQTNRSHVHRDGDSIHLPTNQNRPATRADFDTFRVSSAGYEADKVHYDFPTE